MSAPLHFLKDFNSEVFETHKKWRNSSGKSAKGYDFKFTGFTVYRSMREVFSEKRPIFHIFKSAEVVEAVRLGGTPTYVFQFGRFLK
jgi:hypothetical protein